MPNHRVVAKAKRAGFEMIFEKPNVAVMLKVTN
jgi:hypothetical protein